MAKDNNDDLFEDVLHPEAKQAGPVDDSLFEDTPHPELANRTLASVVEGENEQAAMSRPDVGAGRAGLVGAGQGATFGFAEELSAPVVAAAGMAGDLPTLPGESTWDKYQRLMQTYRDVAREEQQAAQEQQPGAYTTGAVAGGLASPGLGALKAMQAVKGAGLAAKAATGAGVGYGMGGLAGLGEAEGTLQERLPQAQETAEMGAKVGAALPVIGAGLATSGRALSKVGDIPVIQDITKSFQRGVRGQSLITKAGRQEASGTVRKASGELFEDIKALQDDIGTKIQDEIDTAQSSGAKVDLTDEVTDVLARLQKIKSEGSKEAAAYAAGVESEIKKILKIKPQEEGFMGVAQSALPEGLVVPQAAPPSMKIDPKQAQDLKQVLYNYTPKKGMAPQEIAPAGVAKELHAATGEKLSALTERLPELNEQYGVIKDTLKRLTINEKRLPEQIKEKINNVVTKLEKQNVSGDNARELINDVLENLKKVEGGEEIAARYQAEFGDIVERLNLAEKIIKGGESFSLTGTPKALAMGAANIAGLAAQKTRLAPVVSGTGSFAKAVLSSPAADKATMKYKTQGTTALESVRQATEPYKLQRQVAAAAENADPELLKDQARQLRATYGKQGDQLATIMENMSNQDKDARRALMFTVLQNQAYRKMLGLRDEAKPNE